jgi:hypothetical protein
VLILGAGEVEFLFFFELKSPGGTGIHASRLAPASV